MSNGYYSVKGIMISLIFLIASANSMVHAASLSSTNQNTSDVLSVDETVRLVKAGKYPRGRMNPEARSDLIKIIYDNDLKDLWPNAVMGLGYIGDVDDVHAIVERLSILHGNLKPPLNNYPERCIDALNAMSTRNIASARQKLTEMINPEFWGKYDYVILDPVPKYYVNQNTYLSYVALSIYSWGRDPDYVVNAGNAIKMIKDEKSRKLLETRLPACVNNYYLHKKAIASGDTRKYYRENLFKKMEIQSSEREAQNKARQKNREYMRMYADPKARIAGESTQEAKANLAKDADQFIKEVVKPYVDKPGNKKIRDILVLSLADDGVPLFSDSNTTDTIDELFKKKPKFTNDLEQTQIMTRDLLEYKYDLANASIQSFSLGPLGPSSISEALKNPKLNADVVLVSISFKGADRLKEKYPRHFSGGGGPFASQDSQGQPVIHLIYYREMNKWYWNPPGW